MNQMQSYQTKTELKNNVTKIIITEADVLNQQSLTNTTNLKQVQSLTGAKLS